MIQLVERLNTEYDVQNISTRDSAEQALNSLTVSVWDEKKKEFLTDLKVKSEQRLQYKTFSRANSLTYCRPKFYPILH